jgi:hypothetical protein
MAQLPATGHLEEQGLLQEQEPLWASDQTRRSGADSMPHKPMLADSKVNNRQELKSKILLDALRTGKLRGSICA